MANTAHNPPPESNRNTLIIMVVGGVLVAALLVWALTRQVEPTPSAMATDPTPDAGFTSATTPPPVVPGGSAFPAISTATTGNPTVATPPQAAQPTPRPPGDQADVRRIAVEDLKAQVDRGDVTVIDVRDAASFARGHIPGSLNMPFASIEAQVDAIPKGKPIVLYCT